MRARGFYSNLYGAVIGKGSSRWVHQHKWREDLVLKVCYEGDFANVFEWQVWDRMKDCVFISKWLAPCVEISMCGQILVQQKTRPLVENELPKKVPNWSTDWKKSNWGILIVNDAKVLENGLSFAQPVMHDYASHLMMEKGATRRLMTPRWRSE